MNKLRIAFSGASHSGKTSTIDLLNNYLGTYAINSTECIREEKINIDELRSDDIKYLKFELDVIQKKIDKDQFLLTSNDLMGIILLDRYISDSMYYWFAYQNPNRLKNTEEYSAYDEWVKFTHYLIKEVVPFYQAEVDQIWIFEPILSNKDIIENDPFRTNQLEDFQLVEDFFMRSFLASDESYKLSNKVRYINAPKSIIDLINQLRNRVNYSNSLELEIRFLENLITANYGSIQNENDEFYINLLNTSLLITHNKEYSDSILKSKDIRRFPNGFFIKNHIMYIDAGEIYYKDTTLPAFHTSIKHMNIRKNLILNHQENNNMIYFTVLEKSPSLTLTEKIEILNNEILNMEPSMIYITEELLEMNLEIFKKCLEKNIEIKICG